MKRQFRIPTGLLAAGAAFILVAGALTTGLSASAAGPTPVGLGTASSFAVLAGSGVTNTGPTVLNGDLGTFPTTTISGFPPGTVNGTNHAGDAVTQAAKTDLVTAYNDAAGRGPTIPVAANLGGQTLTAGVYNSSSSLGLTGALTLSGSSSDVWIFQAGSTLTTATGSSVVLTGGAQSCNVFWQIGTSATIGTGSTFKGTIIAMTSITVTTGASIDGRALARNGAVTLDTNSITKSTCAAAPTPTVAPTVAPTAAPTTRVPASLPSTSTQGRDDAPIWGIVLSLAGFVLLAGLVRARDRRATTSPKV